MITGFSVTDFWALQVALETPGIIGKWDWRESHSLDCRLTGTWPLWIQFVPTCRIALNGHILRSSHRVRNHETGLSVTGRIQKVSFRKPDFHDRSLSRGQKLSRRATEEHGCNSFGFFAACIWLLGREKCRRHCVTRRLNHFAGSSPLLWMAV